MLSTCLVNTYVGYSPFIGQSGLHQPGRSTNYKRQSPPTTVLLRTTPTRTDDQPTTNSPSPECLVPPPNIESLTVPPPSPQSQSCSAVPVFKTKPTRAINQPQTSVTRPTRVLLRTAPYPDDQPTTNVSHDQQQSFSVLKQPGRSTSYIQTLTHLVKENRLCIHPTKTEAVLFGTHQRIFWQTTDLIF